MPRLIVLRVFLLVLFSTIFQNGQAQDVIVFQDGHRQDVRVLQLDTTGIYCLIQDSIKSDTVLYSRAEIHSIVYRGGITQIIQGEVLQDTLMSGTSNDLYLLGRSDARLFTLHKHGPQIGYAVVIATLGTTCGICGNAIWAAIPPTKKEMGQHPYPNRLENEAYYRGYRKEVWKLRARNVGIGTAIPIAAGIFLVALLGGFR